MRSLLLRAGVSALVGLPLVTAGALAQAAPEQPWRDAGRPVETRVEDLLSRMTLAEKATILRGVNTPAGEHAVGFVPGVPRLGIPPLRLTDGPAGVRDGRPATALPAPVALAASFDPALAEQAGARIGRETKARGFQVAYTPMVNIVRVPQGGRNFETFGEDPLLAARLGVAQIRGVQSQGVAAQVKHFAANNQERNRETTSSEVDERTLRELYLPAFEAAVKEGGAWSLMCAYNKVNGDWACEHPGLLRGILKGEWGFDGVVGSDYPAVHTVAGAAKAGLDQEFGGTDHYTQLPAAVRDGRIPLSTVDDAARRVLRLMVRTGQFDPPKQVDPDPAGGAALARKIAAEGSVLLKNERGLLPLDAKALSSVAVIGPYGDQAFTGGGGSSKVTPYPEHTVDPVTGLRARLGPGVQVGFTSGFNERPSPAVPAEVLRPKGFPNLKGLTAEYFNNPDLEGAPSYTGVVGSVDQDWRGEQPAPGVPARHFSARFTGTLHPQVTGDHALALDSDDGSRLYLDGKLVVDNGGEHNRRTVHRSIRLEAGRAYDLRIEYHQADGGSNLSFGWQPPGALDPGIAKAVAAAKAASVAVVVAGAEEREGEDRPSLSLFGNQHTLITEVAKANPRTVVVLRSGGPVEMPWLGQVPAVLATWFPGEQDGNALADVLTGDVNPAGRLPMSFPVSAEQDALTSPEQYPGVRNTYVYNEKLNVGYRYHDASGVAPLFPFGHGLSYTSFDYRDLAITPGPNGSATVALTVRNTGSRAGSEVPQLYLGFPPGAGEPPRQLRGFTKVTLQPGQSTRVELTLDRRAFSLWDTAKHDWRVPGGGYQISVGASSRDLRLTGRIDQPAS